MEPQSQINQPIPNPVTPPAPVPASPVKQTPQEMFTKLPKNTKMMILVAVVLFAIIFLLLILSLLFGKKKQVALNIPTPTPITVTPAPEVILNASRYATDSGVLKIESDLNNFQKQLETTDVKQSDLSLPNLDWNINFNQ